MVNMEMQMALEANTLNSKRNNKSDFSFGLC